jgi:hypothetical protein
MAVRRNYAIGLGEPLGNFGWQPRWVRAPAEGSK